MYLRFTAPAPPGRWTVTRANVAPGLFRSGYDIWSGDRHDPVKIAIREELDWFNANLPVPSRFAVKAKGRWYRDGVCWFRDSAREVLRHAYVLAALIEECGIRIDRITSRDPGQILYRDDWQVVAMPERFGPSRARSHPPPAGLLSRLWRWVRRGIYSRPKTLKFSSSRPPSRDPASLNPCQKNSLTPDQVRGDEYWFTRRRQAAKDQPIAPRSSSRLCAFAWDMIASALGPV